jgi:DNA-binding LytR/AlgR family response regulator
MKGIKALMFKDCPVRLRLKGHFVLAICLVVWVFAFLWFSEPFEIWRFALKQKVILLSIYSTFCGLSYCFALSYQIYRLKNYGIWRWLDEVTFLLIAVLIAFIFMYTTYYYGVNHYRQAYSIPKYFRLIFLPATLIFLPFVIVGRFIIGRNQLKKMFKNNQQNELIIHGKGRLEYLKVNPDQILYMKSSDNYMEVFYLEGPNLKRKTLRQNLNNLELRTPNFLRTHRSFLVNIKQVKECFFRNKNLVLVLKGDIEVPVSRSMKDEVLKQLPLTTK